MKKLNPSSVALPFAHSGLTGSPLQSLRVFFMEEIWKDIEGFEGLYQASTTGKVRSVDRIVPHSHGNRFRKLVGRELKSHPNHKGYLMLQLSKNGKVIVICNHRVIATTFIDNPLNLSEINHIDEVKVNNSVDNLEWITHIDNIRHGTGMERSAKSRIGLAMVKGEQCGGAKLKESQVIEILNSSKKSTELAKIFGVDHSQICRIRRRENWKHLTIK